VAALARVRIAQQRVQTYRDRILPSLRQALEGVRRTFLAGTLLAGQPIRVLEVLDLQRKELRAEDSYLDALFELADARADLVAAVGDLSLAGIACHEPTAVAVAAAAPHTQAVAAQPEDVEILPALKP